MPQQLTPDQQQAWEAAMAAADQPDLAAFKQALRAARPVLSNTMALTLEQRADLWHRAVAHPDVAWHRAVLKSQPMDLRPALLATTPLGVWNRPRWLNELWSLVVPDRLVVALWRANAPDHLPAVETLFPPNKRPKNLIQGWANRLLEDAIRAQDVTRMRHVWSWASPDDDHWRAVLQQATAPMLTWLAQLHGRGGEAAIPLKHLATQACHLRSPSAEQVFEWCLPLLRRGHKQTAYLGLFQAWVEATLNGVANVDRWLDVLERHLPDQLSPRIMARLCQHDQASRLAAWLPDRAPPFSQVMDDLASAVSAHSPTWWAIVDQIGEAWPAPADTEAWIKANGAHLPRSMARFRATSVGTASSLAARARPRCRA